MDKFGRNYSLSVQTVSGNTLIVELPLTVEFDIWRDTLVSLNRASIRIYNLNANNRAEIRKNVTDLNDIRRVTLMAGYGTNLSIVFTGTIMRAWSAREGTIFVTQIIAQDGGFAYSQSQTNVTIPASSAGPVLTQTILKTIAGDLAPSVTLGAIGNFPVPILRGNTYSGPTMHLLDQLSGGGSFIDNGKINILGNYECLQGQLLVINSATGLLSTPILEGYILHFDLLFEPRVVPGQMIQLQSSTAENFNGTYKIISIGHKGTISESVCGDAVTSLGMFCGLALSTVGGA